MPEVPERSAPRWDGAQATLAGQGGAMVDLLFRIEVQHEKPEAPSAL